MSALAKNLYKICLYFIDLTFNQNISRTRKDFYKITRVPKPGKTPFFIRGRLRFYWVFPNLIFVTYTALPSKNRDIMGLLPGYTGLVQLLRK